MVARGLQMNEATTAAQLALKPEQVRGAFNYYTAYSGEVDQAIRDNDVGFERLKQLLPNLERFEVDLPSAR